MRKYRLHGQMTVLASLILGVTAILAVVCVKSVVVNMSLLRGNESVNLGVESVFSEYLRPLFEEYDILGLSCNGKDGFEKKLQEYMSYNLDSEKELPLWQTVFFKLREKEIRTTSMVILSDQGGNIFEKQVVDYMKYRAPVNLLDQWKPLVENVGDTRTAQEVYEEYVQVVEYAAEIDEVVMNLVVQIDKIRGNKIENNMRRLDTELVLINAVYYTPPTMGIIKDAGFYNILSQILKEMEEVKTTMESFEPQFQRINELCVELKTKSEQALLNLEGKKGKLSKELYEAYRENYQEFVDYQNRIEVIHQETLREAVKKNLPVITHALESCELKGVKVTINNLKELSEKIHRWQSVMEQLDYSGFTHRYEGQSYDVKESGGVLKKLKKLLTKGVLSFVIPENTAVSGKKISYSNLSSKVAGIKEGSTFFGEVNNQNMLENLLFNEYVVDKFTCFTDSHSDEILSLDYGIEYVLSGKDRDRENLEAIVNQLVLIRSGYNLAWLMMDGKRRGETKAYSAAVLGFTGSPAIIKLGQCTLMSVWAYGEALNDVGILLDGGKVPLGKTGANWNTDLMEVVTLDIKKRAKAESESGLTYRDYLRILLYFSDSVKKYYRTMDMVEIGMEDAGYKDVRLSNLYSGSQGIVIFEINGMNYEQKFEFNY